MIPVIEIIKSLRYELGDMQGLNVADHELMKPINRAASLLYGTLSDRFVNAAVKRLPIVIDETKEYSLPPDFIRIHQLVGNCGGNYTPSSVNPPKCCSYRIVGSELYANEGEYALEYYYIPSRVDELDDLLDVPESMRTWIEDIALEIYKKGIEAAEFLVQQCATVLAGREISHFENIGPVQILGGRV